MIRILSTKTLLPNQKQFLLNAGFSVIEANFIQTQNLPFDCSPIRDNLIFTSQNAVSSVLQTGDIDSLKHKACFCVGNKTKSSLEQHGFKVVETADYAIDLAQIIISSYKYQSFTFFSGNLRQDVLPHMLGNEKIDYNEIEVYKTVLIPNKIDTFIDGILFFSPSGVESYLNNNSITSQICFCIGTTTAKALADKTNNVILANQPSVENVIIQTIKYFKEQP